MDKQVIDQFHQIMSEDQAGDGKSVFFDQDGTVVVEDILDSYDVLGEYGVGALTTIHREGWHINAPFFENDMKILEDSKTHYVVTASNRILDVVEREYQKSKELLDDEEGMRAIDTGSDMDYYIAQQSNAVSIYCGLREYDGHPFAGYSMALEDAFGHGFQISWFGTGNMSQLKVEAGDVFQSFTVDFDLNAWMKDNIS